MANNIESNYFFWTCCKQFNLFPFIEKQTIFFHKKK